MPLLFHDRNDFSTAFSVVFDDSFQNEYLEKSSEYIELMATIIAGAKDADVPRIVGDLAAVSQDQIDLLMKYIYAIMDKKP